MLGNFSRSVRTWFERRSRPGARVYSCPRLVGDSVIFGCNRGVVREMDPVSLRSRER